MPASRTTSLRRRAAIGLGDRLRRGGLRPRRTSSWPTAPSEDLADDDLGLLAARVVAGDDDAVGSSSRRRRAISGRLVGSRSPPQPNTHQSSPPRCRGERPQRRQAPCRARRACARSRRRHERLAARTRGAPCGRAPAAGRRRRAPHRRAARPIARMAAITPSRLDTLYSPISCVASVVALRRLRRRRSAGPRRRSRCRWRGEPRRLPRSEMVHTSRPRFAERLRQRARPCSSSTLTTAARSPGQRKSSRLRLPVRRPSSPW